MSKTYPLCIVTPDGKKFDSEVESLSAPGVEGSFGVLAGHAPMLSLLKKGILKIHQNGKELFFILTKGVLEVNVLHHVLVLADNIVPCQSYDEARAKLVES